MVPRRQQRRASCRAQFPPPPTLLPPPPRRGTDRPLSPVETPAKPRGAPTEVAQPEASLSSAGPTQSQRTAGDGRAFRDEARGEEEGTREGGGAPQARPAPRPPPPPQRPPIAAAPTAPSAPARPPQASSPRVRPAGFLPAPASSRGSPDPVTAAPAPPPTHGQAGSDLGRAAVAEEAARLRGSLRHLPTPPAPPRPARRRTEEGRWLRGDKKWTAAETREVGGADEGEACLFGGAWLAGAGPMALRGTRSRKRAPVPIPVPDLCFSSR